MGLVGKRRRYEELLGKRVSWRVFRAELQREHDPGTRVDSQWGLRVCASSCRGWQSSGDWFAAAVDRKGWPAAALFTSEDTHDRPDIIGDPEGHACTRNHCQLTVGLLWRISSAATALGRSKETNGDGDGDPRVNLGCWKTRPELPDRWTYFQNGK